MKIAEFLGGLIATYSPVAPENWGRYARRISAGNGWAPTMLLIALFGPAVLFQMDNLGGNPPDWIDLAIDCVVGGTWGIVCVLAIVFTSRQAYRAMARYGTAGAMRPRYWFEAARFSWNIFVLCVGGVFLGLLFGRQPPWPIGELLEWFIRGAGLAYFVFFFASAAGIAISWVTRRACRGNAYQCAAFFFHITGPLVLLSLSVMWLPLPWNWRNAAAPVFLGTVSVIWLLVGFIASIYLFEKFERRVESPLQGS